jgi:hypothetical protein
LLGPVVLGAGVAEEAATEVGANLHHGQTVPDRGTRVSSIGNWTGSHCWRGAAAVGPRGPLGLWVHVAMRDGRRQECD